MGTAISDHLMTDGAHAYGILMRAMSQENLEIVLSQFESTNARDFAGVLDTWAEDVELILHGGFVPFGTSATGKAAVGEWFGDWFKQFGSDYRFEIEEARDMDDCVFVLATHHGRGRHSGVTVELRTAYVYSVSGGRVSRVEVWPEEDREAALEAAGLSD